MTIKQHFRYALLGLVGVFSSLSLNCQSDRQLFLDSSWVALEEAFRASDDLLDIWPMLEGLENASMPDDFGVFLDRAIPFVQQCFEYGFFDDSAKYLHHLDSLIQTEDWPLDTKAYRCKVLYQLGRLYWFSQSIDLAKTYSLLSKDCAEELGIIPILEYNLIGVIAEHENKLDSAVTYYQKAIANSYELPEFGRGDLGKIQGNLGNVLYKMNAHQAALLTYQKALQLKQEGFGPMHYEIGLTLINMANCEAEQGLSGQAIKHFEEALVILQHNGLSEHPLTADLYLNLGVTKKKNSAYDGAIRYYQEAQRIYEEQPEPPQKKLAVINSNIATVLTAQGRLHDAIQFHEKSLTINQELNDSIGIANNYTNLGVVAAQMNDWQEAKNYYEKALSIWKTLDEFKGDLANEHINLADAHLALGEYTQAQEHAQTAYDIQQELHSDRHPQLAYTLITKARIAYARDNTEEALELVQQSLQANHANFSGKDINALPKLEGYLRYDYLLESLLLKAELLRSQGKEAPFAYELAQQHYEQAMHLLDGVQRELSSREDQITLARNVYRTAAAAVAGSYDLYSMTGDDKWLQEAFFFSERSKANVLLASIAANEAQYFAGIPPELPALEASLQAEIGYYKRQLTNLTDSLERRTVSAKLFESQEAYSDLLQRYQDDYPDYYELRHDQQLPNLKAVQFALPQNELVLSYFTTANHLYRFEITKREATLVRQDLPKRYTSDVRGFNKGIIQQLDRVYLRKAQQLGRLLIPNRIEAGLERLILVPDGILLQLPFEALLTSSADMAELDYSTLPYLINNYQIQYAPSVSLYNQAQTTTLNLDLNEVSGLLAYAPVFPGTTAIQEATRSNPFAGEQILPLPETEREVSQLARLFLENDREAQTYLYQSANEHAFKESELGKYRYLHVATHGFVNEAEPDLSGLLLYPDSTAGEDGLLAVGEVYNLSLNAELVTLSACETGIGQIASGEGVLGFTRAFLYAGAERVLVSLWQVQDAATADLITAFYQELLETEQPNYSTQLREAKLKLIQSERFSHPYYWSPFILIRG